MVSKNCEDVCYSNMFYFNLKGIVSGLQSGMLDPVEWSSNGLLTKLIIKLCMLLDSRVEFFMHSHTLIVFCSTRLCCINYFYNLPFWINFTFLFSFFINCDREIWSIDLLMLKANNFEEISLVCWQAIFYSWSSWIVENSTK